MDALSAREASLRESLVEQRAKNSKLEGQIRALQSEPSDDELAKLLAQYKKQIDALNTKLARFKNDKNLVTKVCGEELQGDTEGNLNGHLLSSTSSQSSLFPPCPLFLTI